MKVRRTKNQRLVELVQGVKLEDNKLFMLVDAKYRDYIPVPVEYSGAFYQLIKTACEKRKIGLTLSTERWNMLVYLKWSNNGNRVEIQKTFSHNNEINDLLIECFLEMVSEQERLEKNVV